MKKFTTYLLVALASLVLSFSTVFSQENTFAKAQAMELVKKNISALGLTNEEVNDAIVSDAYYNAVAGTRMVYLQQGYKGLPLMNTLKVIAFKNEKPVSVTGRFLSSLDQKVTVASGQPSITAADAVAAAALDVNRPINQGIFALTADDAAHKYEFPSYNAAQENITANLIWIPTEEGAMNLCWQVKFVPVKSDDYFLVNVDALTGKVIDKINLTIYEKFEAHKGNYDIAKGNNSQKNSSTTAQRTINSATYRVVQFPAESPGHGNPTLITNPWLAFAGGVTNPAATLGWHNDGTADHDSTRGNNVYASEDLAATNIPGKAAVSTTPQPNLTFDFPFDPNSQPSNPGNRNFAITQLFYWNNVMHDYLYQYGFDEAAGNFQNTNLGRGGLGSDYVNAFAQDGAGTNNANMSTPVDGQKPRMRMYLFDPSTEKSFHVNSPANYAGYKLAIESNFSTANKLADVGAKTGDLMLYDPAANNGCAALTGTPLAGKIALIDRGTCNFVIKVKNAQDAGAIGVVMVNNVAGAPIIMGGTDNTITIPAVMTSLDTGLVLKTAITGGETVNVTLAPSDSLDGSLDNGVMGHEYFHGVSNRLTGGPSISTCLNNTNPNGEQMGEGWSDYAALMMNTDWQTAQVTDGAKAKPIGTYVMGQLPSEGGIRTYPYSTNMAINPWKYDDLAANTTVGGITAETHLVGEIWAATLWDMTWNIIQMDGINTNFYNSNGVGGNSVAFKLVMEGMKLQPCRPGFLDGRDGILKADTLLYNGRYSCAIWKAFARRGMGMLAKQGSSNNYADQVTDSTAPAVFLRKTVDKTVADQNEELTYTISANCKCVPATNYTIVDTLGSNVTYVSGGTYNPANRTVTFNVPALTEGQTATFTLKTTVNLGSYTPPVSPVNETVPTAIVPVTFTNTGWSTSSTRSHSAGFSLVATDPGTAGTKTLTTTLSYPVTGITTLSFWHYYNTERHFDGGYVELSTDNGTTWFDAAPYIMQNGYTASILSDSRQAYSGSSNGQFIQTLIKLSQFSGKLVKFRFVFKSNASVAGDGWYIDDITLTNEAGVFNMAGMFDASNKLVYTADTSTLITSIVPVKWGKFTADKEGAIAFLKWSTLQEQNTSSFIVERSFDGTVFEKIGSVKAAGNSNKELNYSLIDPTPARGINYYRIQRVDRDGKFSYSEIRSVTFDNIKGNVTISPNPATDKITVSVPGNTKSLNVTVYSAKGDKVGSFVINGEANKLNLPGYAKGVYYVTVTGDDISTTEKIVIQ